MATRTSRTSHVFDIDTICFLMMLTAFSFLMLMITSLMGHPSPWISVMIGGIAAGLLQRWMNKIISQKNITKKETIND